MIVWAIENKDFPHVRISLGCDIPNGPRGSFTLWKNYMPCVELNMLEFQAACASKNLHLVAGLYTGDQANVKD
jgi:hypothetical protein